MNANPFTSMAQTLGDMPPPMPRRPVGGIAGPNTMTERMRQALRDRGPLDTADLARVANVSRAVVWALLKDDIKRGRIRRMPGTKPLLLKIAAPAVVHETLTFYAIAKHGWPDAEITVFMDSEERQGGEPWAGWWTGEKWVGLDGFPCEQPTHWAHWPRGVL